MLQGSICIIRYFCCFVVITISIPWSFIPTGGLGWCILVQIRIIIIENRSKRKPLFKLYTCCVSILQLGNIRDTDWEGFIWPWCSVSYIFGSFLGDCKLFITSRFDDQSRCLPVDNIVFHYIIISKIKYDGILSIHIKLLIWTFF